MKTLLLLSLSTLISSPSFAGLRTKSFAGLSGAVPVNIVSQNMSRVAQCVVTVVNTGTVDQTILDIQFLTTNVQSNTPTMSAIATTGEALKVNGSSAGYSTNCLNANGVLNPGQVCLFKKEIETLPFDGNWAMCSGQIRVRDTNAGESGQISVAGTVYIVEEARVLGGVLTAAQYRNVGARYDPTSGSVRLRSDPAGYTSTDNETVNMNQFCVHGCRSQLGLNEATCWKYCGLKEHEYNAITTEGCRTTASVSETVNRLEAAGFKNDEFLNATGTFYNDFENNAIITVPQRHLRYRLTITDTAGLETSSVMNETVPGVIFQQKHIAGMHCQTYRRTPTATTASIYPRELGGGAVYEMTIGPFASICSGNEDYINQGGTDFTFNNAPAGGPGTVVSGDPPQRLICNQRHDHPDLYFGVGQAHSFSVNGGKPF
ncbi:MAG: hypothetical protein CL678_12055 [Bdellovibrionaceae bacterium]|nr:hypothetical protein [Pseudobdellovibrionaceae bacterium]|tara:strand:- start:8752 stop:10044 length:1293 start_codon:yes stop_codon:yes gene_type:complete